MRARGLKALLIAAALTVGAAQSARAACGTTKFITNTAGAIQNAVNAIGGGPLASDYCIFLATGAYIEAVTVQKIATGGFRIVISTYNPGVAGNTQVTPLFGNAAFTLINDSVTLNGMTIYPSATGPQYGITSSSANVVISSVIVNEQAGSTFGSGAIVISSYTTITLSSMTASTVTSLDINGSSNTISQSTFTSTSGNYAVLLNPGSNDNVLQQSVFSIVGSGAAAIAGSSNTFSQDIFTNNSVGFTTVQLLPTASSNTIRLSSLTNVAGTVISFIGGASANNLGPAIISNGGGGLGVDIDGSPGNSLTGLKVTCGAGGGPALIVQNGSHLTSVQTSTFNAIGAAATVSLTGVSSVTITQSSIGNFGTGSALAVGGLGASYNAVSLTTMTATGPSAALVINFVDGHETFVQDYMSNQSGLAGAVQILGNSSSETITQSRIAANAINFPALYMQGVANNAIIQTIVTNALSTAAWLDTNANGNTIQQSTFTSGFPGVVDLGNPGIYMNQSSTNTIIQSVLEGGLGRSNAASAYQSGAGLLVVGGTSNTVVASSLIGGVGGNANTPGGDGLTVVGGSSVAVSWSTLAGGAGNSGGGPLGGGFGGSGVNISGGNNFTVANSSITGGTGAAATLGANGGNGGQGVILQGGASFVSIAQSGIFAGSGGAGSPGAGIGGGGGNGYADVGAMWGLVTNSFMYGGTGGVGTAGGPGGAGGSGALINCGQQCAQNTIIQSTMTSALGAAGSSHGADGQGLQIFGSSGTTVTQSYMSNGGTINPGAALQLLHYSTNTFISQSTMSVINGGEFAAFVDVGNSTITASVMLSPLGTAARFGPNALGSGVTASLVAGATGFYINGATGTFIVNDNIRGTAALSEALLIDGGIGVTFIGNSSMTATGLGGYALLGGGFSGPITATGPDVFRGKVALNGNVFQPGNFIQQFGGDFILPNIANWLPQTSTAVFDGSNDVPAITYQQIIAPTGINFNGFAVNVTSVQFFGSGGNTAVFTDNFAGSTVTFPAGGVIYSFGDFEIHGGPPPLGFVNLRSSLPGTQWEMALQAVSSVTAASVSDSNASFGITVQANDQTSVGTFNNNTNWNFLPFLAVTLPGQVYNNGVGNVGPINPQTAGVPFTASVYAVSSSSHIVTTAAFPLVLNSTDVYGTPSIAAGLTQTLVNGTTNFSVTLRTAEPSPHPTQITATPSIAFAGFGQGFGIVNVSPNAYTNLQVLLPGEATDPGSPTGKAPVPPDVQVQAVPISAVTVRSVDQFFNLESASPAHPILILGTSASSSSWPSAPQATVGGMTAFVSTVTIFSTGTFVTITSSDNASGVANGVSSPFIVALPSFSSPTASLSFANSYVATLAGSLNGGAADATAVNKVLIGVQDQRTLQFLNRWPAAGGTFTNPGVVYGTATLSAQGQQGSGWTIPFPDFILTNKDTYLVTMVPIDASLNSKVYVASFTFEPGILAGGGAGGFGAASVLPVISSGCEIVITTVTFTVGAGGIQPGGAVAVHEPEGWLTPLGVAGLNPPPVGFVHVAASNAPALAASAVTVNASSQSLVTLGPGWITVVPNAVAFNPGDQIIFTYAGIPALNSTGRGPQIFTVLSQPVSGAPLSAVVPSPLMTLSAGTTNFIRFADITQMQMGSLQSSPTMQLELTDLCGNPTSISVSTAAFVFAVNPAAGSDIDASAIVYAAGGNAISSVTFAANAALSQPFYYQTSTAGVAAELLTASGTFSGVVPNSSFVSQSVRAASLLASTLTVTGVSIDTGTPNPGQTVATVVYGIPHTPAVLRFNSNFAGVPWAVTISTDPVAFYPAVFRAAGVTDLTRPPSVSWDGLNSQALLTSYVSPSTYYALISLANGVAQDTSLQIKIPASPFIYGNLGVAGAGSLVKAQGPGGGFGNQAQASATGYFQIFGLVDQTPYDITATTGVFVSSQNVSISAAAPGIVAANAGTAIPGTMSFPPTSFIYVSATLATPAPRDMSGVVSVHNASYTVTARGNLHFFAGFTSSDNGALDFSQTASSWTILALPPDLYSLDVSIPALAITTSVAGVSLAPGAIAAVPIVLTKKTNVFGYAVLPSTSSLGHEISISAQALGALNPTVFAKAFVSPASALVRPTSGTYSLYGLDPGSWTINAQSQGFASTQTTVLVSTGGIDIGDPFFLTQGLDLHLSTGGVIVGTITIVGNTMTYDAIPPCGAHLYPLGIQAVDPVTGVTVNAPPLCMPISPTSASSSFTITGVSAGTYTLTAAALFGVPLPAAGGGIVSVTPPVVQFTSFTAVLSPAQMAINIQIPPLPGGVCHSTGDFRAVGIQVPSDAFDPAFAFADVTLLTQTEISPTVYTDGTGMQLEQYFCSSMTWTKPNLYQGGVARFGAFYNPTGASAFSSVSVIPGGSTTVNLNLNVATFTVSGQASMIGSVNLVAATVGTAIIPPTFYTVTVSSIPGLISASTPVAYCLLSSTMPQIVSTLHLELIPLDPAALGSAPPFYKPFPGAPCNGWAAFNGPLSFTGYVAAIQPDGSFQFPGVTAGDYLLRNDPDLENHPSNGVELAAYQTVLHVTNATTGIAVPLGRGNSISGVVNLPPGMTTSAPIMVLLQDSHGSTVSISRTSFNNANGAAYEFSSVADGQYALIAQAPNFAARPVTVAMAGASLTGQNIALQPSGTIKATIGVQSLTPGGTSQFTVINQANQSLLPSALYMDAVANPWYQGGIFYADAPSCPPPLGCLGGSAQAGLSFDPNGQAVIHNVLPGTYNVEFNVGALLSGNGTLGLVSTVKSGVTVSAGQTVDLGVIAILGGSNLSGVVTDAATSSPAPNVQMVARPSAALPGQTGARNAYPSVTTDAQGRYSFTGLDPTVRFYDIFAGARLSGHQGDIISAYDQTIAPSVDIQSTPTLNFALAEAPYSVSGQIVSQNNELLQSGFGQDQGTTPGAAIFLQKSGKVPTANPLADIVFFTDQQGNFTIPSLTAGTYSMIVMAQGYANAKQTVVITTASIGLGPIALNSGATLTGSIYKPDGSSPGEDEIGWVIGATPSMSDFIYGAATLQPNTLSVSGYRMSGFQLNTPYRLIFMSSDGQQLVSPPEASNIVFTSSVQVQQRDIIFRPSKPFVVAKDRRVGGTFNLVFQLSQPLRERTAADDDFSAILTTVSAQGILSNIALFNNRQTMTAVYTPGVNESSFTLSFKGYTSIRDPDSIDPVNPEFVIVSTPSFFVGIDGAHKANVNNLSGGVLVVEGDQARVNLPKGAFGVDASSAVTVLFQKLNAIINTSGEQSTLGVAASNVRSLAYPASAYPAHMIQAIAAVPQTVNPFSAFYDILLPLGLRTALSRPTPMTISYSTGTDPTTLNLYWYNAAANAYILQQDVTGAPPVIDTVNHTITINVNHFSTFVLFNTGVEVITGNAFPGTDITVYNFPNPFDLNAKNVFAIHGGSCAAGGGCTVRGTMISIAVPPGVSGDGTIRIYNVAGERVRQIDLGNVTGGNYLYQDWDGRNNTGSDVASGVYIGQVKIGDHAKFFKMALIK